MEAKRHQTLRFERRLVLLCEKMTAKEASEFEMIDRDEAYRIERRWLARAESGWTPEAVSTLGIDEIAVRKGRDYATVFYDLSKREVVGMLDGRKAADCSKFLKGWDKERRNNVEAVCMDMWEVYHKSVSKLCPKAAIVFDKFHISKCFHAALDKVRKHEQAFLPEEEGRMLKGARWLWHKPELSPKQRRTLRGIMAVNKPLFKAYLMVEDFERLYSCESMEAADKYLKDVIRRFRCSHLAPFKKLGASPKPWRDSILNYFKHSVSNAAATASEASSISASKSCNAQAPSRASRTPIHYKTERTQKMEWRGRVASVGAASGGRSLLWSRAEGFRMSPALWERQTEQQRRIDGKMHSACVHGGRRDRPPPAPPSRPRLPGNKWSSATLSDVLTKLSRT